MSAHQEENAFLTEREWGYVVAYGSRILRGAGYAIVAALLMSTIDYHIRGQWTIILVVGLLGLFTSSARIGQFGVLILLAMALISPEVAQTFVR